LPTYEMLGYVANYTPKIQCYRVTGGKTIEGTIVILGIDTRNTTKNYRKTY